uniref:Uncharacterized protein n=1 Tax=Timema tahoe TaxID=61484 RepID=A0A7R9IRD0_9NEOP|nr:unnamed protein product [Timema tahoe]
MAAGMDKGAGMSYGMAAGMNKGAGMSSGMVAGMDKGAGMSYGMAAGMDKGAGMSSGMAAGMDKGAADTYSSFYFPSSTTPCGVGGGGGVNTSFRPPPHLPGGSDPKWAKPHDWTIMLSQHNQLIRSLHLKVGAGGSYSNKSPDRWTSLSVPALSVSGCEVVCSDLLGHDGNSGFRGLVCWFNECTACFSPSPHRKYRNHYLTYSVSLYRVSTGLGKREMSGKI